MNIKNVRIKNFRCFSEKNWDLNDHFNILIGNNATGKTAVLDAISIGIGSFFLGIDDVYAKTILSKDVRRNTFKESREYQLPCEIELSASIGDSEEILTWQRSVLNIQGNTRRDKDTNKLVEIAASLQNETRKGEQISLPVFNYYGTGRLWTEKRKVIKTMPLSSKFDAYQSAIEPIHSSAVFTSWMKTRTLVELQTQVKDEALVLVKAITSVFLHKDEKIEYDVKLDSIMLDKGTSRIEWNELSDGYRNVIAMAADLAYRCYTLNSHLGLDAAEKSKGVILIDEIDLHLHPSWQRTIVESFKRAFPNLQFIATTHSPFIVQSLNNSELIDLQGKDMEVDYYKKGIEDITENEMHVDNPIRSEKYKQMLNAADVYYSILQNYKQGVIPDNIQRELDEIESQFSSEPAYVALLKSERKANSK